MMALAWLLSNDNVFIYSVFLYLCIWLLTVYSESRLSFSHTWRGWARVFTQIRFLQASYLQHDRRLPFLVGISLLVDFVSASELTYHLRLTFAIGRIDSVIRRLVRIIESTMIDIWNRCGRGQERFNKKQYGNVLSLIAKEIVEQRIRAMPEDR